MGWKTAGRLLDRPLVHIIIIAALGVLVYSTTFHVPFVFDDGINIIENPAIKDFKYFLDPSWVGKLRMGNVAHTFKTRYVGYLTLALNYKLGALDVRGYHAFNLAVHITNALLVYWLVRLTLRTPFFFRQGLQTDNATALFAALLFVSHPVQTQAVTYIVQRFASLAATFYLLSVVLYVKARLAGEQSNRAAGQQGSKKPLVFRASALLLYCASLLSALLAMKTKENSLTLPFVILLCEAMFFRGPMKKRLLYLAPVFLTLLVLIPLSLVDATKTPGGIIEALGRSAASISSSEAIEISHLDYLLTESRVMLTYFRLLFLPMNQNLDYDYPMYRSFFSAPVLASTALLALVVCLGICLLRLSKSKGAWLKLPAFGIFWFFIALSVESGAVPIADVIFEHRLYLPSAGAFIALAAAMAMAVERYAHIRKPLVASSVALVLALSCAAYARNGTWRNEVRLWEDVVEKAPRKSRGYYNLGVFYKEQGRHGEAERAFLTAIALKPNDPYARNDLGIVYAKTRRLADGVRVFEEAAKIDPGNASIRSNLGAAYQEMGRHEEAERELKAAITLKPDCAAAHDNLGFVYETTGRHAKARREYEEALRLDPGNPNFRSDLERLIKRDL